MAQWWNKKYEFKIWSSLWVFLKEIEGLDDQRNRQYLEQLLEKRYDTVDVLKLATKQDLVEDADILPGDALRIIAAAKAVVARRNVPRGDALHSEIKADCARMPSQGIAAALFTNVSYSSAEPKAVAQEIPNRTDQGKGILPLPSQNIFQQGSQIAVPNRIHRLYYACGLCQITCISEYSLKLHFRGKKHADRMDQGEDDGRRTAVRYAGTFASGQLVISPKAYYCSLCDIRCSCKRNLIMHFKGRKHQALMEEVSDEEHDYYSKSSQAVTML